MDLYESLKKQENLVISEQTEKFYKSALLYAEQGFDEESLSELVQVEGCPIPLSKKVASAVINKLPIQYNSDNPPKSFFDVKDIVHNSIKSASIDKLKNYFNKFSDDMFGDIVLKIEQARVMDSKSVYDAIVAEIEPYINGIIVTNEALSNDEKFAANTEEKEIYEQELFGLWPVKSVRKRAQIDKADKLFLKRAKVPGDTILF